MWSTAIVIVTIKSIHRHNCTFIILSILIFFECLFANSLQKSSDGAMEPLPEGTYFYSNYKLPSNVFPSAKLFAPISPNCLDFGVTVCSSIDQYPTDLILGIVSSAEAAKFNFSSIFLDETINDIEPKLDELIMKSMKAIDKGANPMRDSRGQIIQRSLTLSSASSANIVGSLSKQLLNKTQSEPGNSSSPLIGQSNAGTYDSQQARAKRKLKQDHSSAKKVDYEVVEDVCKTKHIIIEPKVALNDRSEWKYIVNLGERDVRLRQTIRVELCSKPKEPCSSLISLPFGYVSRCKQKYIKKKLLALDLNGQSTSVDNFFVPACCACEILKKV